MICPLRRRIEAVPEVDELRVCPFSNLSRPHFFLRSVGVSLTILSAWIFTVTWSFAELLYYSKIGPPLLPLRSGMLAISMIPFVYILAAKSNFISVLIGYGPEKLNVLHRWLGRSIFFRSLVHTIAFVMQPVQRGQHQRKCSTPTREYIRVGYW